MKNSKPYSDKISAADKAIGLDFQYYYFLYRLLNLRSGEKVGLEVLDDVHTTLVSDRQILIQLKHTIQTKSDGSSKNLTSLDIDLWKSLSNWSQIITDKNAERDKESKQLDFIKKTDFLLVSNKSENAKNIILQTISEFQNKSKKYNDLLTNLTKLKTETKDDIIKSYIQKILDLNDEVGEAFFRNLRFDLGCEDIIAKCKIAIKEDKIPENKIDDVFNGIDSQIRTDNFFKIKNREKIIISFDDFYKKYRRHYDLARNEEKLSLKPFTGILPDNLTDQTFVKQLIDIEDIKVDDIIDITEFTRHKLLMQGNIDNWHQSGDLTANEADDFDKETKLRWFNEHRKIYRQCSDGEVPKKALELLDSMRKERLSIASQELPTDMSNGQYYRLSDTPEIGWHKDWEKKYK
jgi:hypothetical protein